MHAPSAISEDGYLRVNGLRLHCRDLGDRGASGRLPARLEGHAYEWEVLLAELAADHRVVAFDQRGPGRSSWAASYRPAAMVADVLGVVDALGLARFHLVGHSMGGVIAMLLAAQRPDLINRLVIIDIGPDSLDVEWGREELPVALQYLAAASYPTVQDAVDEWLRGAPYVRGPLMRHYVEHALRRGDNGRWVWRFDAGRLYDFIVTASSDELWAALDRITTPSRPPSGHFWSPDTCGELRVTGAAGTG